MKHPEEFQGVPKCLLPISVEMPESLSKFVSRKKKAVAMNPNYPEFREWLLANKEGKIRFAKSQRFCKSTFD